MEGVITTREGPFLRFDIPYTDIPSPKTKCHQFVLSGTQKASLLRSSELTNRFICLIGILDIELRDLVSWDAPRVRNSSSNGDNLIPKIGVAPNRKSSCRISWRHCCFVQGLNCNSGVLKGCVAETISKLVAQSDIVVVEPLVVDKISLGKITDGSFADVNLVVRFFFCNSVC